MEAAQFISFINRSLERTRLKRAQIEVRTYFVLLSFRLLCVLKSKHVNPMSTSSSVPGESQLSYVGTSQRVKQLWGAKHSSGEVSMSLDSAGSMNDDRNTLGVCDKESH